MPYIKQDRRDTIDIDDMKINRLVEKMECAGDLNYVITKIALSYMKKVGTNYSNLNSVVGVLECAKLEFYRKVVSPYENQKIQENGEVM